MTWTCRACRATMPRIWPLRCRSANVSGKPVNRHVLLAYTEEYAIEYLGRKLRPYWQRNGRPLNRCSPTPKRNTQASKSAASSSTLN